MAAPNRDYYIKKYGEEEGSRIWDVQRKKRAITKENLIAKYGEEDGTRRWDAYREKHRVKMTLEGFLAKGKTKEDWERYNASRAVTKENLISRHGLEEGEKKWESYKKKQAKAGCTLEHFVEKYGEEQGTSRYLEVNSKKAITLKNMIRVHGEEEGIARYDAWVEATRGNYVSELQKKIINEIVAIVPTDYLFHDGIFGKEFCVYSNRAYMYDFVITHPVKICIEINGDYWHANPKVYNATDYVQLRGGGAFASQIWENDRLKKSLLESRGFLVYYIWESDWNENKNQVLENVKSWISLENA